jgi:hypothetical protein
LFGADDPIGRTFRYAGVVDLTVTGVIGEIAQPSHIGPAPAALLRFDVPAPWDALERVVEARRGTGGAFASQQLAYAVLPEGSGVSWFYMAWKANSSSSNSCGSVMFRTVHRRRFVLETRRRSARTLEDRAQRRAGYSLPRQIHDRQEVPPRSRRREVQGHHVRRPG